MSHQRKIASLIDGKLTSCLPLKSLDFGDSFFPSLSLSLSLSLFLHLLDFKGLRRMNMRATVGHKDVFLSYAHININFARRLKVIVCGNGRQLHIPWVCVCRLS